MLWFRVWVLRQEFGGASLLILHGHRAAGKVPPAAGRGSAQEPRDGATALVQPAQISLQMCRRKISFSAVGKKVICRSFRGKNRTRARLAGRRAFT